MKKPIKIITIIVSLILVVNIILFALRLINEFIFWTVIAAGAVFSYFLNKKTRIKNSKKKKQK